MRCYKYIGRHCGFEIYLCNNFWSSKSKTIKFLADDNISFEANEGEVVGILGPNGAGKTTLLRIIAGIMSPTGGEVIVDGRNHKNDSINIKKDRTTRN